MNEFSRRTLLGGAVAAAATTMWNEPVHAQYGSKERLAAGRGVRCADAFPQAH